MIEKGTLDFAWSTKKERYYSNYKPSTIQVFTTDEQSEMGEPKFM